MKSQSLAPGVAVTIAGVCVRFCSNQVLQDLNCRIAAGEFVAVIGRSGSGKSTLLRLIAGLQLPTTGNLLLDNESVRGVSSCLRMMFQEGRLLPWFRILQNVELGLGPNQRRRALDLLERVGLFDRIDDWPAKLSGGQRQRVALARALAAEPRLLLLDEPLGSLDALTRIEMQRLVEELWLERRFTSLLITHDVEEAITLADRVLLLEQGRIAGEWSVDLPRPRDRTNPEFVRLTDTILTRILTNLS